jgi:DeoR/GlpR family transcriptional regulator of sugar metabolism
LGKEHRLVERRQEIIDAVGKAGKLSVAQLSDHFDVSEVTIRQDLQELHDQGFLLRTRGGAVSSKRMPEMSFDMRQQQNAAEKARIGHAAAALVSNGDTLFLDASTTAHAMIPLLKKFSELTVVTNSLKVALAFLDAPQIQVTLPGGHLRRESISLVGLTDDSPMPPINIQTGFFGARGLTLEEGLTDVNMNEVALKRRIIQSCRQVVALVGSHKWGKVAAYTFARLPQIDMIITDPNASKDLVKGFKDNNIEIKVV